MYFGPATSGLVCVASSAISFFTLTFMPFMTFIAFVEVAAFIADPFFIAFFIAMVCDA